MALSLTQCKFLLAHFSTIARAHQFSTSSNNNYTIANIKVPCYYCGVFVGLALEPTKVKSPKSGNEHAKARPNRGRFLVLHDTLEEVLTTCSDFARDHAYTNTVFPDVCFECIIGNSDFFAANRFFADSNLNFFVAIMYHRGY